MRNVSPGSSSNNTSSSSLQYSVPSQVGGITLSVVFFLEAVLIVAGNFLTLGLFAQEKKTSKEKPFSGCKHGFRRFNFRSGFLAFVCLLIYRAHVSAMEMGYIIHNVEYRLGRHWYHLLTGIINICCFYSPWTFLRHLLAAKTPNFVNQSVLHYNCHHLDAGFACFGGVQPCQVLNFRQSSYVCLDVIPFAVSIYRLSL